MNIVTATNICRKLNSGGFEAYIVGGAVRDTLMDVESHDIDIATNALPNDVQRIFPDHIDTGLKHGTVSVRLDSKDLFEVTTYRIDGKYEDGRHPSEVVFTSSIIKDLSRRDFTINAIAFNPISAEFMDPFNGQEDIRKKVIRCVGNAKDRFIEDPLRVLRAIRFAIKLGFTIDIYTAKAMHDAEVLYKLKSCISKERITEELRKILTCGKSIHSIFSEFSDVIAAIIPEIKDSINAPHNNPWHQHNIYDHSLHVVDNANTTKFEIKLAALLHDIGKPSMRTTDEFGVDHFKGHPKKSAELCNSIFENSLRLSNKEKELVHTLVEIHDVEVNPKEKAMRRLLIHFGEDVIRDLLILKYADSKDHVAASGKEERRKEHNDNLDKFRDNLDIVIANMNAFSVIDLEINGFDVMTTLNIKSGKQIGHILNTVFNKVVNEELPNERIALIEAVKEFKLV